MRELVRTNDIVLVSAIGALLDGANIHHLVLDQNMSIIEGSLGVLPRRILVHEDDNRAGAPDSHAMPGLPTNCGPMTEPSGEFTEDAFLGGQLRLRQPKSGHRAGHDAMLLAAATPARPGDRVVDFGAGVGAAGLAVARRVAGHRARSGRDRCGAGGACARQRRRQCDRGRCRRAGRDVRRRRLCRRGPCRPTASMSC